MVQVALQYAYRTQRLPRNGAFVVKDSHASQVGAMEYVMSAL